MRSFLPVILASIIVFAPAMTSCRKSPQRQTYPLRGEVTGLRPGEGKIVVTHDAIEGVMPGMTMPFAVSDTALLRTLRVGDSITATLVISDGTSSLDSVRVFGRDRGTQDSGNRP